MGVDMRFKRLKLLSSLTFVIGAVVLSALAQTNVATDSKWEVLVNWGQLPAGANWGAPSQVSTTPEGQIVVFRRMVPSFFAFNPDGSFVKSWGYVPYRLAHGIRIDKDGFIWVTDNTDNFIQKFSADGKLLMTVGHKGVAGDNNSQDGFDGPADVFVAPNGDFFVADGYRNSRVVQFSKDGKFIRIIGGTKGTGPGQFNLPHAIVLDSKGRIIVADAENSRIQVFDPSGKFIEQWTDFIAKPRGALYITADDTLYVSHVDAEAVSVVKNGKVVDIIRGVGGRPHGMTLDKDGNIYVSFPLTPMVKKIVKK
jgi:DNA-binding beta-propeller fold protein YncE